MSGGNDGAGRLRGIVLLSAAVSLFGVVDGLSKVLAGELSIGQIVLARYALALPLLLIATGPGGWPKLFRTGRPGLQLLRGLSPLIISAAMIVAVTYLPLAEATVIMFAGPFMVVALSGYFLGERVSLASWIGVAVGFLAVLIVARPGFTALSGYAVFPLIGAAFYALLQLLSRKLASDGEDPQTTLAWTLAVGLIAAVPLGLAGWTEVSATDWLLSLAMALAFGASHLLLVRAYAHAPASVLAPFSYVQIIAAVIFGIVAFYDIPDPWTIAGIVMIIAAGAYVMKSAAPPKPS